MLSSAMILATAMVAQPSAPAPARPLPAHSGAESAAPRTATEPLRRDAKGRPVIAVKINDRDQVDMMVDTGAQVSLVTAALATELALPKLSGGITVQGTGGATEAALYGVDHLSSAVFDVRDTAMPELTNSGVTTARGIIGMDVAVGKKLTFDLTAGALTITPSGPPAAGFVAIKGRIDGNGLLVVPITINGTTVDALIDTGSQGIVAGPALLDQLGWTPSDPRLKAFGTMRGAGGRSNAVRTATMDTIRIGPARLSNVPVVITSTAAYSDHSAAPMILGSNALNLLPAYALDFSRAELHIKVPTPVRTNTERSDANHSATASPVLPE